MNIPPSIIFQKLLLAERYPPDSQSSTLYRERYKYHFQVLRK